MLTGRVTARAVTEDELALLAEAFARQTAKGIDVFVDRGVVRFDKNRLRQYNQKMAQREKGHLVEDVSPR